LGWINESGPNRSLPRIPVWYRTPLTRPTPASRTKTLRSPRTRPPRVPAQLRKRLITRCGGRHIRDRVPRPRHCRLRRRHERPPGWEPT
jgi:hypothetical protein